MKIGTKNFAKVKIENVTDAIVVPISTDKPDIPDKIQVKWQKIVDLMARIMQVPSGQITRFTEHNLEIFAACADPRNPFKTGDAAPLGTGMFCETVVGLREKLLVSDIRPSQTWRNNPFASTGMVSYVGVPILWEDGELFGTLCFLDDKTNEYSLLFHEFILEFKGIIEADLQGVLLLQDLRNKISGQEMLVRESHHRINNHFSMLIGYIQLRASERESNRDVHDELLDIQNRIRSISLIHEKLSPSSQERMPPLDVYISQLSDHIIADVSNIRITMHYEVEPIELSTELTVAIGLIVSELTTNSIKYAFSGATSPQIGLTIKRCSEKRLLLHYCDNGIGLPAGFDIRKTTGLGMTIIRMQVEQLHGELQVGGTSGAEFRMVIDG